MRYQAIIFLITVAIFISCRENVNVNLGGGYKLITSASMDDLTIVNEKNVVAINCHVLDYAFDSTFIIVTQRPRDSVPECSGKIPGMTLKKSQEAFENSTFKQYWIINKKEKSDYSLDTLHMVARYSNIYGPFKKEEYLQKREEIGVPQWLRLRE